MRLEVTHTVKAVNYAAFMQAYKDALAVDRESQPAHIEPRVLVTLFGEINKVRIEFEMKQSDMAFQTWLENGCPAFIEGVKDSKHEKIHNLSESVHVSWLKDVDVTA